MREKNSTLMQVDRLAPFPNLVAPSNKTPPFVVPSPPQSPLPMSGPPADESDVISALSALANQAGLQVPSAGQSAHDNEVRAWLLPPSLLSCALELTSTHPPAVRE